MIFPVSIGKLNDFATAFWDYVNGEKIFAFHGAMGAGKTTLIEALCRKKGVKDVMGSPTFSIINEYVFLEDRAEKLIYHIDLYRLKDEQEIVQTGVEDCIYSNEICFVEWPDKAPGLFDENTVHVFIEPVNETERTVKISLPAHSIHST
jgi:tRNA threonylcarbamoyladenosine biosynthesis protein TsaE